MKIEIKGKIVNITSREFEVISLIANGKNSSEAADVLELSKRTIDFHLLNLYRKLGINSRMQAVKVLRKSGVKIG